MFRSFEDIRQYVAKGVRKTIAVAAAHDETVLHAVAGALREGYAGFALFGDSDKIIRIATDNSWDISAANIVHCNSDDESVILAVKSVSGGCCEALMKGNVPTAMLLRAVLDKDYGLRTGRVLSHVGVFEYDDRMIIVTDGGMVINPDLQKKSDIILNSLQVTTALGISKAKVAVLAAVEVVNADMQCTLDAAALTVMNARGQIKGCVVDGPLALDNALSFEAARHKGIVSDVAGYADVLLVPDIQSGNMLAKSFTYVGGKSMAGLIVGARAPIVLTSRADSFESKLNSIALAALAG